jgi:hypothetical protein
LVSNTEKEKRKRKEWVPSDTSCREKEAESRCHPTTAAGQLNQK